MIKVNNPEEYGYLFEAYKHNIPVIYSHLEGQYNGQLYVDTIEHAKVAILFTPFDFHYVGGDASIENAAEMLDEAIFSEYLVHNNLKEAIVFTPDEQWDTIVKEVFKRHNGLKGLRNIFHLDKNKFKKIRAEHKHIADIDNKVEYLTERGANSKYPESRIYKDGKCISFCSGFMIGNNHAEIDVGTEQEYRGNGYAKQASIGLMDELLARNIEPDWCAWTSRKASEKLALSLGFNLVDTITAHIWVEEECGTLNSTL